MNFHQRGFVDVGVAMQHDITGLRAVLKRIKIKHDL